MTLRNSLFKMLHNKTAFQLTSLNQRHPSKTCTDNRALHFSLSDMLSINQSVKYQNVADKILQGHPVNDDKADRPHH